MFFIFLYQIAYNYKQVIQDFRITLMYLPQRKAQTVSSLIVVGISCIVIFGWITNNTSIVKLNPSFPPMQFNTAIGFGSSTEKSFMQMTHSSLSLSCSGLYGLDLDAKN